jgi:type VI secretion system secreted protein Hcp
VAYYYLKVVGQKQGWIKGGCMQKGKEYLIDLQSWSWGCSSPRDAATGQATGKRQHRPINFNMTLCKASPLLAAALVNNENLTEVVLTCMKPDGTTGAMSMNYKISLVNASMASMDGAGNEGSLAMESISMTYQKITWEYLDPSGTFMAVDDLYLTP